ncbi:vacuolar protein sorting-associated protein 37A [Chrysoperla carnea]|uniref:vacuolar protein sorting-associated protein 37A n=1 Tax=Chrysoperla carnea TaxID=189513 RepID=UPI001D07F376|nr:vacuolar protein sorting-associated protein 37A [Chrysoperla carnea]
MLSRNFRPEIDIRKRQIDTLKIFNDNVTELTEGTDYKIVFTAGNNELTLNVYLSGDFPNECPQIRITPLIVHPWVSVDGQVTKAPGLLNYTIHSDLGRVVHAIIREFERNPPVLASEATSNVPCTAEMDPVNVGRASPVSQNYGNNYSRLYNSPTRASTSMSLPIPMQAIYFPELNNLTIEELQKLKESESKQDEFLDNLIQVKEINDTIDALILQIENIAVSSLSKQDLLFKKKQEVLEKIEKVSNLKGRCETLNRIYQSWADKYTPSNIQNLLEIEAMNKDKECEAIATNFLSGEISIDKFLQNYVKAKKSSQLCKTKADKLANQLIELKRKGF